MNLYVNDNIPALDALRNLDITQGNMTTALQRLSSGLQINSAADNPAGLAIAQQMQSQVNGLNQAQNNSQDGVSLVQTADSALSQVQNLLQSMRQLAVQASSSTQTSTDRANLQQEVNQYAQEITQITNTTQFNTKNLLAGGFNGSIQTGANAGETQSMSINAMDAQSLGVAGQYESSISSGLGLTAGSSIAGLPSGNATVTLNTVSAANFTNPVYSSVSVSAASITSGSPSATHSLSVDYYGTGAEPGNASSTAGWYYQVDGGSWNSVSTVTGTTGAITGSVTLDGSAVALSWTDGNTSLATGQGFTATVNPTTANLTMKDSAGATVGTTTATYGASTVAFSNSSEYANFNISTSGWTTLAGAAASTVSTVDIASSGTVASTFGTGTSPDANATVTDGINISSAQTASLAISSIDTAIQTVSSQRAQLGAVQNRLQYTIANLASSSQNLTAARAQIMDVNVAAEMTDLAKYQILQQTGVAVLAQAQAMPQAVLKLLG